MADPAKSGNAPTPTGDSSSGHHHHHHHHHLTPNTASLHLAPAVQRAPQAHLHQPHEDQSASHVKEKAGAATEAAGLVAIQEPSLSSSLEGDEKSSFIRKVLETSTPQKARLNRLISVTVHDDEKIDELDDGLDETDELLDDQTAVNDATYGVAEEVALKAAEAEWLKQQFELTKLHQHSSSSAGHEDTNERLKEIIDPVQYTRNIHYRRVVTDERDVTGPLAGSSDITKLLRSALHLRQKYMYKSLQSFPAFVAKELNMPVSHEILTAPSPCPPSVPNVPEPSSPPKIVSSSDLDVDADMEFQLREGVYHVYKKNPNNGEKVDMFKFVDIKTYLRDMSTLLALCADGPSKSFAFRRMQFLKSKFEMYNMLNETDERTQQKMVPHRDFYNVRKVDTHVHLSSCMNQKHLLRFIKSKLKKSPNEVVIHRDGRDLTLAEVFKSLNLTAYDLSIDTLDMHADRNTFHRFDKFNLKYNPIGESRLREIFIKSDNLIKGKYYAEVCREVFNDLEESKYQMAEYRVSIYGRSESEWTKLADWFVDHKLDSPNVRWLIQFPRLFNVFFENKQVATFQEMLRNMFHPLFEVSRDPSSNRKLAQFLEKVVGFDSVDDESKPERNPHSKHMPTPDQWKADENPPYSYYIYYLYANITVLNQLRSRNGLNTFSLRPHSGEAGAIDHLVSCFLAADGINHGIMLRKVPVMQYLYYLAQIPIAMSPLSNNSLFLDYHRNPFVEYFNSGLFVSLSTDDPLQFHYTREPLIEEYSIAAQVWKLTASDMCEIAANSVKMSGFSDEDKVHWLGKHWKLPGPAGNDIKKTNVPDIRVAFRFETLLDELKAIRQ